MAEPRELPESAAPVAKDAPGAASNPAFPDQSGAVCAVQEDPRAKHQAAEVDLDESDESDESESDESEGAAGYGDEAPTVAADAPEEIRELCAACVAYVLATVGVAPDFTVDTLPLVDFYIAHAREGLNARPEASELLARSLGAYFGEVVRRRFDGYWRLPTSDAFTWRVCIRPAFFAFNPVGVSSEILAESSEHPGPSAELRVAREDRELIRQRLEIIPELPENEYFTLSARLEAIEVIIETLRATMEASGQSDLEFSLEDYETDLEVIGNA